MDNEPWQKRIRALGLKQSVFARAVGRTPTNLSYALRGNLKAGVPRYLTALIVALEMLTPEQRTAWLEKLDDE